MKKLITSVLLTMLFLPLQAQAQAQTATETAAEQGRAIAEEAERRDTGWGDVSSTGVMILRDSQGRESRRAFKSQTVEVIADDLGDRSVIVFTEPRDIRGTATLTHSKVEPADDDQWLFLPAIKRVKRISSSNRTGKFVGSEFSFEDLGAEEIDDFSYNHQGKEPCPTDPALTCFKGETFPLNTKSGYSKRVGWIDTEHYRLQKVEFYNRRGELEKIMTFEGYQQYLGQFWRPAKMLMVNVQTKKSTDLLWDNYKFNTGLTSGDLVADKLQRMAR